jgi:hypothetical protein
MAIYQRFEDLPVWQEAARLYNSALDLLQIQKLLLSPGWRFQFERAALSFQTILPKALSGLHQTN